MAKCSECDREVMSVRDQFTGATFYVDAEPQAVRGYQLARPEAGERIPRGAYVEVEVFVPHAQRCEGGEATG